MNLKMCLLPKVHKKKKRNSPTLHSWGIPLSFFIHV